eukprot:scaffold5067_cov245-Pinguiococcus_pyrenoidosus.AAC.3
MNVPKQAENHQTLPIIGGKPMGILHQITYVPIQQAHTGVMERVAKAVNAYVSCKNVEPQGGPCHSSSPDDFARHVPRHALPEPLLHGEGAGLPAAASGGRGLPAAAAAVPVGDGAQGHSRGRHGQLD